MDMITTNKAWLKAGMKKNRQELRIEIHLRRNLKRENFLVVTGWGLMRSLKARNF
tara:strand:+ start:144 stop:308 length:165 start_codon:yes stop_codon:yes gene_type:complete